MCQSNALTSLQPDGGRGVPSNPLGKADNRRDAMSVCHADDGGEIGRRKPIREAVFSGLDGNADGSAGRAEGVSFDRFSPDGQFRCCSPVRSESLFADLIPLFGGVAEFASQAVDSQEYSGREIGLF
jgi:hypothetical protein